GLEEPVPGTNDSWRNTPLGRELHLDLLRVFMGAWDEGEMPMILEEYGFISDLEVERIYDLFEAGRDPEIFLKNYVRDADCKWCAPSRRHCPNRTAAQQRRQRRRGDSRAGRHARERRGTAGAAPSISSAIRGRGDAFGMLT